MNYQVKIHQPAKQITNCIVIPVFSKQQLSPIGEEFNKLSQGYLKKMLRQGDFDGDCGQTLLLYNIPTIASERVLLMGCGDPQELKESDYRKILQSTFSVLKNGGSKQVIFYLQDLTPNQRSFHWKIRQAIEAIEACLYQFDQFKSKKNNKQKTLSEIIFHADTPSEVNSGKKAIEEGIAITRGIALTKNLGNLPSNICTPSYLAHQAKELAKKYKTLKVNILEEAQMKKLNMGALLSVSQGSREPAKLICVEYKGSTKSQKPIVLVGKGITFDTGGISLKPPGNMDEMKYDMCGTASIMGTLTAIAELKLPIHVVGVMACAENMPGGSASKPGDIVTTASGQTVEILNTDAEGRLVLCDALTYCKKYKPHYIIDVATLTGAVVVALGTHACGVMGNDPELISELLKAANQSSDRAWQLPVWEEYGANMQSNFADFANANTGDRNAGAITAAWFLSRFTKEYRWAHIDIAGVAYTSGREKGATGRPVSLLTQFLLDQV